MACFRISLRDRQLLLRLGDGDLRLTARRLARGQPPGDGGELGDPRLARSDRRLLAHRLSREAVLTLARSREHQFECSDALLGLPDLLDRFQTASLIRWCEDLQLRAQLSQACSQAVVVRR